MDFEFEMMETLSWGSGREIDFRDDYVKEYDTHDLSPLPAPSELELFEETGLWPFDYDAGQIEEQDRLGNHEIQRLMQIMNQNDTLEANVRKKTDDTANAIIGKI
jgi:hypothetical protein